MPAWPSIAPRYAAIAVVSVPPRHARRAGRASRAGRAGGARRARQTLPDAVPLEGDAPRLEFADLLLVGDEDSCLRDEDDGQRRAECKAALRATPRLFHTSHIIPHVMR
ncbi:hypothetical protein OHA28_01470 [Streptomyces sp. NBC_00269]|uniref:hypothetical protein n=1 Tax=Streptomyces sp. NBC_00269 TaxID=2975696 RepID=UPI002E2D825F|nr:hypothetical protein [Streptomyces sp. NBC_00269]